MKDLENKVINAFGFPVKYNPDGQFITDQQNNIVCEVRGWGTLHSLSSSPEEVQDTLGEMIAMAFNEKYEIIDWDNLILAQEFPFKHEGRIFKARFYRYIGTGDDCVVQGVVSHSHIDPDKPYGIGADVYLSKQLHKNDHLKQKGIA